ncbi:hypothetical protein ACPA9J_11205 [Pseudomonas aeruginosa]
MVADMATAYEAMITAAKVELLNTYPDALEGRYRPAMALRSTKA